MGAKPAFVRLASKFVRRGQNAMPGNALKQPRLNASVAVGLARATRIAAPVWNVLVIAVKIEWWTMIYMAIVQAAGWTATQVAALIWLINRRQTRCVIVPEVQANIAICTPIRIMTA